MFVAWRPLAVVALVALAAAGGAAQAAHAGTASGHPAQFTAIAGEGNDVTVDAGSGGAVQFIDAAELVIAGLPWCVPFPLGQALCDPDGDPRDTDGGGVSVDLGDKDDRAVIRRVPGTDTRPGRIRVTGGAGDDRLENSANGVIHLDGGDGRDMLVTGATASAVLLGGSGADLMDSSAGCCAIASYNDHDATGVRVTLDGSANDGLEGEGDDVRTSAAIGSPGPDVITGGAGADTLIGSGGADVLEGGGGDDLLNATLRYPTVPDRPDGPDGRDTVTCGAGDDDVVGDDDDTAAVDCERIRVGRSPGLALVFGSPTARADRWGSVKLTHHVAFPNPDNALVSRSTLRLVDGQGRPASSIARFVLGGEVNVARARVRLNRAARRRLARSRSGTLRCFAQRVSRAAGPGLSDSGYEQFHVPMTIRRAGRR